MKTKVGGYVSYDTQKKDDFGWPIRETLEVYTEVDLEGHSADDCGYGTNLVVKALEEKVKKRFKTNRNVECRESWQAR